MMTDMRIHNKGRVNKTKSVRFSFNGKTYSGFEGDTLASALLANGEHLAGRSFKYHRPRGILSAGSEEPNALMGVDQVGLSRTPAQRCWNSMMVSRPKPRTIGRR